jgi:uncharacterized membrane protein
MAYDEVTTINVTGNDGFSNIFQYINVITDFWAGRMVMIAVFVLFLFGYLRSKNDDDFVGAFAVASYVTFVIGLLMWLINFLDGVAFGIIMAITIVATAILLFDKRGQ